jgi:hypothetical protein
MPESYTLLDSDSTIKEEEVQPATPAKTIQFEVASVVIGSLLKDIIDYADTVPPDDIENILNIRRLKKFKGKYTTELLRIIREQDFEYGFDSPADLFVRELLRQNLTVTKEWLNSIFIDYFDDTRILIGLLQIISHIDYLEICPEGATMALAALSHVNPEVRECGIRAFENWGTVESLKVLRNVKCQEKWLQEYVQQVILDLEEELC